MDNLPDYRSEEVLIKSSQPSIMLMNPLRNQSLQKVRRALLAKFSLSFSRHDFKRVAGPQYHG